MTYVDALQKHSSAAYRDDRQARRVGARNGDLWCHLFADTVDELRTFARRIGLSASWIQGSDSIPHFDLTPARRAAAVAAGAREIDRRQTVDLIVRLRRAKERKG